jgi:hypothetical protein
MADAKPRLADESDAERTAAEVTRRAREARQLVTARQTVRRLTARLKEIGSLAGEWTRKQPPLSAPQQRLLAYYDAMDGTSRRTFTQYGKNLAEFSAMKRKKKDGA